MNEEWGKNRRSGRLEEAAVALILRADGSGACGKMLGMPRDLLPLDYATPAKYSNPLVSLALISSVLGGPAGAALGIYIDGLVGEPTCVGFVLLIAILAINFIFACIVRARLRGDAPLLYRTAATGSCLFPILWSFCLYWLVH